MVPIVTATMSSLRAFHKAAKAARSGYDAVLAVHSIARLKGLAIPFYHASLGTSTIRQVTTLCFAVLPNCGISKSILKDGGISGRSTLAH